MTRWKYFVLGRDKTPLPNCSECAAAGPEHDREACLHLVCHGFYAATDSPDRLDEMMRRYPDGHLAVRTGQASGIIVLDAEGTGTPSGLEVLDDWENWVGGWPLAHTRCIARTPSGGVHRYYRWEPGVKSRNRVLPSIDIKSDGGYVVVPNGGEDRRWVEVAAPALLTAEMLNWLRTARGRHSAREGIGVGHTVGYDYDKFLAEGCPGGSRDEFFNELIFRMRKAGMSLDVIYVQAREHWKRCAQPSHPIGGVVAAWYMPFHHVEYKIKRIWQTVEPIHVADELRLWAEDQGVNTAKRVTLAPRSGT